DGPAGIARQIGNIERKRKRREQRRFVRQILRRAQLDQRRSAHVNTRALDCTQVVLDGRALFTNGVAIAIYHFQNRWRRFRLEPGVTGEVSHRAAKRAADTLVQRYLGGSGHLVVERVDAIDHIFKLEDPARGFKGERDGDRTGARNFLDAVNEDGPQRLTRTSGSRGAMISRRSRWRASW